MDIGTINEAAKNVGMAGIFVVGTTVAAYSALRGMTYIISIPFDRKGIREISRMTGIPVSELNSYRAIPVLRERDANSLAVNHGDPLYHPRMKFRRQILDGVDRDVAFHEFLDNPEVCSYMADPTKPSLLTRLGNVYELRVWNY
jgi:hypothetical protein